CEQEGLWPKALTIWQNLLVDAAQVPGGRGRVLYAIGACHMQLEPPDPARAEEVWQEALKLGGAEGQAAGLRLGARWLLGSPPDTGRGLKALEQALAPLKSPADYRNPYFELPEVRGMLDSVLDLLADLQDYDRMRVAAELYRKVAPAVLAEERVAQA